MQKVSVNSEETMEFFKNEFSFALLMYMNMKLKGISLKELQRTSVHVPYASKYNESTEYFKHTQKSILETYNHWMAFIEPVKEIVANLADAKDVAYISFQNGSVKRHDPDVFVENDKPTHFVDAKVYEQFCNSERDVNFLEQNSLNMELSDLLNVGSVAKTKLCRFSASFSVGMSRDLLYRFNQYM